MMDNIKHEAITNEAIQICPCKIQDIGIIAAVDQVHATIIFDKNCPIHGHIGRKPNMKGSV